MLDGEVEVLRRRRTAPMADRGMIVSVVSWLFLVAMVFTLLTRLAMKWAKSTKKRSLLGLDDVFIVLAAIFSVGQTAAVSMEAMHALGQHQPISESQLFIFLKAEYAGCMLYIANMGCSRISVCLLVKKILPGSCAKRTACAFAVFSLLWTISGILVTAFPCSLPNPWNILQNKCINVVKFVNYVGITNIVVEVFLVMIPLFVWNLRLSAGRSVSVSCVFLARLSVVAAIAAQLAFFNEYALSRDYTYDYWRTVLCVQIAQNLAIITACIPCLHPFILGILSGETKTEPIRFECETSKRVKKYLHSKNIKFDATSSQSSTLPITEKGDAESDYCRPLATYGLDRSSAHLHSQHFNRFPTNVAQSVTGPNQPENVFMRHVPIPSSRPTTAGSQKELPPIPKTLSQVGVLPIIDWDTDSSDRDSGRSSPSRRPKSDYIFKRDQVISVPEANALHEQEYWKKYPPPPSGEK